MKDVQCYELFGGIALKKYAFSIFIFDISDTRFRLNAPSLINTHKCKYVNVLVHVFSTLIIQHLHVVQFSTCNDLFSTCTFICMHTTRMFLYIINNKH